MEHYILRKHWIIYSVIQQRITPYSHVIMIAGLYMRFMRMTQLETGGDWGALYPPAHPPTHPLPHPPRAAPITDMQHTCTVAGSLDI